MDGEVRNSQEPSTQIALEELGQILHNAREATDIVYTVVHLAKGMVPNTDEASVTLIHGDMPYTAASTGITAAELDEHQYQVGYSPCLDSAATGLTIAITDTSAERGYTAFAARAHAMDVGSVLSVGLPVPHDNLGALSLYSRHRAAFNEAAVRAAQTFAAAAAVALANRTLYADAVKLTDQLQTAMQSRATIDQAKGILMRDNRCSPDEAFTMLVQASSRSNRKLRDIAASIVEGTQLGR